MARLALKLAAFAVALAALQFAYAHLTGYKDAPSTVREFDRHMAEGLDVIYFGDSTLYRGRAGQDGAPTTPQILQDLLPGRSVGSVYHDAYDPRLILRFCEHMTRQKHRPEVIIVPINLRAFSLERSHRPEYQFVRESLFLKHDNKLFWAFYRPLAAFGFFDLRPVTQEDYLQTEVYDAETFIGTFAQIYAREGETFDRDMIRALYFYPFHESHPQLEALLALADLCTREGVRPLFYVTPIDYQRGNECMGGEFQRRTAESVALLVSALGSRGGELLDLSFSLGKDRFVEVGYPDTYLDDRGKRFVAERLAAAIKAEPHVEANEETAH